MFENLSVFHFLIFATGFGFIAAIIYTNIQRTALSKFISYLVENNINSEDCAVGFETIGLKSAEKSIIKSAVKKQNGLKNIIHTSKTDDTFSQDKLEQALSGTCDNSKYYLSECDTSLLLKKYSFKTMSTKHIVMFISALIAVVIISTFAVDWLIKKVSLPEIEKTEKEPDLSEDITPDLEPNTNSSEDAAQDDETNKENEGSEIKPDTDIETTPNSDSTTGPVVPYF